MSLRRTAALAFALAAACAKEVKPEASPGFVDYAVFDPSTGAIPLPNDLALLPQSVAGLPAGPQRDLLEGFLVQGGFPNDQEVPITIQFTRATPGRSGASFAAPQLDLATIGPSTLLVLEAGAFGATPVAYEVAGYAVSGTTGTLTLRKPADAGGRRLWNAGAQLIVAVRGGDHGVKMQGGGVIRPQPAMYLLLQGRDLTDPANQALLPDPSAGPLLEQIRQNYLAPFTLVDAAFPSRELAVLQTFKIAPARTHVVVDEAAGVVPLPSNFLLDYTQSPPRVRNIPAFGPAAVGLATLDGFSTTGMLMATTSAPIDSTTVKNDSVFLFRVTDSVAERVWEVTDHVASGCSASRPATFVAQPPPLTGAVPLLALQPAVPVPVPGGLCGGLLALPPLEESSDYVVVITNRVKDANGVALGRTTPASLLLFQHPLVSGGVPTVPGLEVPTATLLEILRQQIAPAIAALPAGLVRGDVAIAYPVHTQSITGTALQLAALPYSPEAAALCGAHGTACEKPVPAETVFYDAAGGAGAAGTVASVYSRFGVDALAVPQGGAGMILVESEIYLLDLMDPDTGAFRDVTDPTQFAQIAVKPARILVAVPSGAGLVPLVVFQHGIEGSRAQMLMLADRLTSAGFAVAAIDLPFHGHRAFCNRARVAGVPDAECVPGNFCVEELPGQGEAAGEGPGLCRVENLPTAALGTFIASPVLCVTPAGCAAFDPTAGGIPAASGDYLVSSNFFRTRDALRQAIADVSQLVRVLTPIPATPPVEIAGQDVFNVLLQHGTIVDPAHVHWVSHSLGSMVGTVSLAANPRFERAVLAAGGATIVDVMLNSPGFKPEIDALFAGLGIPRPPVTAADQADTLQLMHLLKWILDPADPINFARHVTHGTLANLLASGGVPGNPDGTMLAKDVIAMNGMCDQTITNPFQALLDGNLGLSPILASVPASAATVQWYTATTGPAIADTYPGSGCPAGVRMKHSFLMEWGAGFADAADRAALEQATQLAQAAAAGFLTDGTRPATPVVVPTP